MKHAKVDPKVATATEPSWRCVQVKVRRLRNHEEAVPGLDLHTRCRLRVFRRERAIVSRAVPNEHNYAPNYGVQLRYEPD